MTPRRSGATGTDQRTAVSVRQLRSPSSTPVAAMTPTGVWLGGVHGSVATTAMVGARADGGRAETEAGR